MDTLSRFIPIIVMIKARYGPTTINDTKP